MKNWWSQFFKKKKHALLTSGWLYNYVADLTSLIHIFLLENWANQFFNHWLRLYPSTPFYSEKKRTLNRDSFCWGANSLILYDTRNFATIFLFSCFIQSYFTFHSWKSFLNNVELRQFMMKCEEKGSNLGGTTEEKVESFPFEPRHKLSQFHLIYACALLKQIKPHRDITRRV